MRYRLAPTTVKEAASLMCRHEVLCLPVFADKKLKGIVTASDLFAVIGRGAKPAPARAKRSAGVTRRRV